MQVGDKVRVIKPFNMRTGNVGTVCMLKRNAVRVAFEDAKVALMLKGDVVVVHEYNVTIDWPDGSTRGFIVWAISGDMAIAAAKGACALDNQIGWSGSSLQRREENNSWFDNRYPNATRI